MKSLFLAALLALPTAAAAQSNCATREEVVERLNSHYGETRRQLVHVKIHEGNHDPHTARIVRHALAQRYRDTDRVQIEGGSYVFHAFEWRNNLLFSHHGNIRGLGIKDLVMMFAARYAAEWGRSGYRELHTGHMHHLKTLELPGVGHYQHRAAGPASRHDIDSGYFAESELTAITYHKNGGRVSTASHLFRRAA